MKDDIFSLPETSYKLIFNFFRSKKKERKKKLKL